ncbi:MAG: sulfatase-like hydrolase/transferase [Bacteroidota bacterium]
MFNKTRILLGLSLLSLTGCEQSLKTSGENRINIIFLMADDLGYGDLSCYGSQSIETPHIDQLAGDGMKFTHFYSGSAVCSPSRASLLTGKFPLRYDVQKHFSDSTDHLPRRATTLAELLKGQGYQTCHIGKWHLGGLRLSDIEKRKNDEPALPGPLQHGFDHYLANIEGRPIRRNHILKRTLYRKGGKTMLRNDERASAVEDHWTEIKVTEAIQWLSNKRDRDTPFFLNMWFDVPHTPYEPAPAPHLSKYRKMGVEGDQLLFRSMVSHLDAEIGRLVDYLKENDLYENTLIVFTSDNGPAHQGSPGPFKGGKTDLHEGGIRVPMIAVLGGKIPEGTISFQPVHMVDLLPTISSLTGFESPRDLDGIDMTRVLLEAGKEVPRPPMLFQMFLYKGYQNQGPKPTPYATGAVIDGNWKLLTDSLKPVELINLARDHREIYNLLKEKQGKVDSLLHFVKEFHKDDRYSWRDVGLPVY